MTITYFKHPLGAYQRGRQRGASLLEAVAFLGIAAIVILGAVALLRNAFGGASINKTQQELVTMRTNVTRLFSSSATYGTSTLSEAIQNAGMAPGTLTYDSTTNKNWINSFNGRTTAGGAGNTFWVAYTRVAQDACVTLATNSTGWLRIKVTSEDKTDGAGAAGATAAPEANGTDVFSTPMDVATASSKCGDRNTIIWYN